MGKPHPALPKVDVEMRRWCAALEEEISTWPSVTSRPMFGLQAFYRGKTIFAVLPRTRAMETPFSLHAKFPGRGWVPFVMDAERDLPKALRHLERGYAQARAARDRRSRPRMARRAS